MEHDNPTVSNLGRPAPSVAHIPQARQASGVPDAPDALVDLSARARSEVPTWPGAEERARWMQVQLQGLGRQQKQQAPAGYVSMLAFGISLGANVVLLVGLVGLLGVLWLSQAGAFAPGGVSGQTTRGGSTHGALLSSPTATASLAPGASWLQVSPSSVQLRCGGDGQQTQVVMLENTGPQSVDWQVTFSVPQQQAGVAVDPQQGRLDAGASMPIQLQITTQSTGRHGGSSQQGVIAFAPAGPAANSPANLTYAIVGCR